MDWKEKEATQKFNITVREYKNFINTFLEVAFEDKSLQKKLKNSFKGFDLRTWPDKENQSKPDHIGSVGHIRKGDKVVGIEKWAYIGEKKQDGTIETDFDIIKVGIHELLHSVSAKHDLSKKKQYEKEVAKIKREDIHKPDTDKRPIQNFEIDPSTGEIESNFGEMLFNQVLYNDLDKLKKKDKPLFGLTDEQIKREAGVLKRNNFRELGHKIDLVRHYEQRIDKLHEKSLNATSEPEKQAIEHLIQQEISQCHFYSRYVVGYAGASLLESQYIDEHLSGTDSKGVMVKLNKFLENGNKMTKNDIVSLFTDAQISDFKDVEKDFWKNYHENISHIEDGSFGITTSVMPVSKEECDKVKDSNQLMEPAIENYPDKSKSTQQTEKTANKENIEQEQQKI